MATMISVCVRLATSMIDWCVLVEFKLFWVYGRVWGGWEFWDYNCTAESKETFYLHNGVDLFT
jgi:hypothetical protein